MPSIPSQQQLLKSECTSYWLKDALVACERRDILDALRDAEMLAAVLRQQLTHLDRNQCS